VAHIASVSTHRQTCRVAEKARKKQPGASFQMAFAITILLRKNVSVNSTYQAKSDLKTWG